MNKKKVLSVVVVAVVAIFCSLYFTNKKEESDIQTNIGVNNKEITQKSQDKNIDKKHAKAEKKDIVKTDIDSQVLNKEIIKKEDKYLTITNMYNDIPSSALPLSAISLISECSDDVQSSILKIAETNNIYMIQPKKNKLLVISDNPSNIRHSVEFTEISINNSQQIKTTFGYNDKIKDSDNEKWEYNDLKQPTKHTKYNKDGDIEFVEVWNYDSNEPIKYEMKDAEGKVISLRKETLENGTDLRIEHLLYDKNGKTQMNVSATFEGEDLKRFTYYNADKPNESGSIFSDYSNGLKTKETVYTTDLKVKNSYTSDYKDDNRENIIKWDNKNQEVRKYLPKETL